MKRFLVYIFALLVPLFALAQTKHSIEIDASSFKPVNTDALTGVAIDKIEVDNSLRPCARIKLKVNRMTREDISNLQIKVIGGIHDVMKKIVAHEGNGLIIELTAKPQTRFYLHHDKYGDSNEVTLNLEGNKEYRLDAELCQMYSIVVSTNVIGADIYLDNELKGKSDDTYVLTVNNVMAGNHSLCIEYESMKHEQSIFVSDTNIHFKAELNAATSRPQYVVFQVEPKGAAIVIDDKSYAPDVDGIAMAVLHNGSHTYTISAKDYHNESGTFVVSGAKVVKSITLRPAYGWLNVSGSGALQGASIYVDGQLVGTAPLKSDRLASGTHTVRIVKSLYKAFEENVTITDGKTLDYAPSLVADFATVSLNVGGECDIYVNNEKKGSGSWRGDLATGAYIFEARKAGHTTTSISKTISATPATQSYTLPAPKPIVGTLNVMSSPAMADVYVDGKLVGQTPLMVDVIIGKHEVSLRKGELGTEKQSVNITEGQTVNLNLTLAQLKPKNATYVETIKGLNMKMVYVEGGTLQMGATTEQGSDAYSEEKPVHSVTLSSYYIAECEVTQAQWRAIMGNNPSCYTGDNNPVEAIYWEEAKQFCEKLSQLTGKKYTLPTEAQWEYAARGGEKSQGYKYSGSNDISAVAWYMDNSNDQTHPVKQKSPNELGLYDMTGNVLEWCSDWYYSNYYSSSSQTNPTGPSGGIFRVVRGGCWGSEARNCRVSYRGYYDPSSRSNYCGFRIVCLP